MTYVRSRAIAPHPRVTADPVPPPSPDEAAALAASLLAWYDVHRRHLPWREAPGTPSDPYRVWVSEAMLQQVRVETVARHYDRFLARWPTAAALARAELEDVLRAWSGLGRYARAHNLHAAAQLLAERHGGVVPGDEAGLRGLPGIGPYTAAAVRAIAFGQPVMPVDGNVERVLSRLFGLAWTPGESASARRAMLHRLAQALAPADRPGCFAQAVMDLGATVCIPPRGKPRCDACPWRGACAAHAAGTAESLPLGPPRPAVATRPRYGAAFLAVRPRDGAVLLRRRPPGGPLAGTLDLPGTPWRTGRPWRAAEAVAQPGAAPFAAPWRLLRGRVRHALSSYRVELAVLAPAPDPANARAPGGVPEGVPGGVPGAAPAGVWVPREALEGEALSVLARKLVRHALDAADRAGSRRGERPRR